MMKRTKADWVLLIEEQMESKVSIAEFCRIHAISVSAFYNARSRFGYTASAAKTKENENPEITDPMGSPVGLEKPALDEPADGAFVQANCHKELENTPAAAVCFEPVQIAADLSCVQKTKASPAAPPGYSSRSLKEAPIVFMLNGIELVIPSQVSQANLGRIVQACLQP